MIKVKDIHMRYRRVNCLLMTVTLMVMLSFPIIMQIKKGNSEVNAFASEITTESSTFTGVESKRIYRWGLKRSTNGGTPEVGSEESRILLNNGGIYIGDVKEKVLYLTFDEGHENGYTDKILDVLKDNGVQGIFFITGDYLERQPELVRRMVEEGHEVGNHTLKHPSLATVSNERVETEILELDRRFFDKFNKHMRMMRPPMGEYNDSCLKISSQLNNTCVMWSFAYEDWNLNKQKGTEFAFDMVNKNLHNGAIILLHAVSKDNAEALDKIIKEAKKQGYSFGNADLMLRTGASKASGVSTNET